MTVILNCDQQHCNTRYLLVFTLFGEIIHCIIEQSHQCDVSTMSVIKSQVPSIRVRIRVDGRDYTDKDRCSMQVNGLLLFTDTGTQTQVNGHG